jgi:hypothetical protein
MVVRFSVSATGWKIFVVEFFIGCLRFFFCHEAL